MKNLFRRFLLAFSFLTILPFGFLFSSSKKEQQKQEQDYIKDDLSKSSIFFPIVGILIGLILVGTNYLLALTTLDTLLVNIIILIVWVFLSGGLHLEGFADMVDGFSGGKNQQGIIRIMKDGAIGAKGAIALTLLIIFKLLLINNLSPSLKLEALLLAPVIGRWSMVLVGYSGKPASADNSLSRMFTIHLGKKELLLATFFTVIYSFYLLSYFTFHFLLFSAIITYLLIFYSFSKMQGICGDIIGAVNELNEIGVLLFFLFLENLLLHI